MLNLSLAPVLINAGIGVHYIGSSGMEKELVAANDGIKYHTVLSGKLRRYISFDNLLDVVKVGLSIIQCVFILIRLRPVGVFSKGGYVAVPVCLAAWILRIPVVSHESDLTPGLATKIISKFSKLILTTFEETSQYLRGRRTQWVGSPLRESLKYGDKESGLMFTGFQGAKPVLLIVGGSLGAQRINDVVLKGADDILAKFDVVHLTGKGKKIFSVNPNGYIAYEYLDSELKDIIAMSDFVVSRAGANSIFEFLQLGKPMLLIPLEIGSRGDQVENAEVFIKRGWATVLNEKDLTLKSFLLALEDLQEKAEEITAAQKNRPTFYSVEQCWTLIQNEF